MELDHEFTVPVPVDQAWPVLLDVERIAPCMPGATLDSVDGDDFTGRLKVKLGAMTITYKGSARIAARDEETHTVSIEGTGKEARGAGTASANVQAQLHGEGDGTRVTVHTKLNITGRPAQFGRNIMAEVGGKLIGRFADNLAEEIARPETPEAAAPAPAEEPQTAPAEPKTAAEPAPQTAPAEPKTAAEPKETGEPKESAEAAPEPAAQRPVAARSPNDEAINLLEFAGPSIAKRLAPLAAGLVGLWGLWRIVRRVRRK
ncbi:SRPBCC family protein [Actinoallomurus acaciae]|uniref:SRPBCC family protein n=1 Tax=Actinoallomurus acaciae TaxID=502577 RepID=A0ABV5YBM7_9ACTN